MKSNFERIDSTSIRIDITLSMDDWRKAANRVYNAYSTGVEIPGFRPGKATRQAIDRVVGADQVFAAIKEEVVNDSVLAALREHKLNPIAHPNVDLGPLEALQAMPLDEELGFNATVEIWPDVADFAYKGLTVNVRKRQVAGEDIERGLKSISLRFAERSEIKDRAIEDGDWVTFDFKGTVEPDPEAVAVEGDAEGEGEDDPSKPFVLEDAYTIHVGQDESIPGIAAAIRGLKKGEEKDFEIIVPGEFPIERVRGRRMQSHAVIRKAEELKMPELTDEFVKEKLGLDDLDALKKDLRESMENTNNDLRRKEANEALEEYFINTVPLIPPKFFIESREETILENMYSFYKKQDRDLDEILRDKEKAAEIRREIADEADKQVRLEMVYDEIARREKIEIKPEEVQNYLYMMQYLGRLKEKDIKKLMRDRNFVLSIRNDLKNKKVIDLLYEKNEIIEVEEIDKVEKRVEEPAQITVEEAAVSSPDTDVEEWATEDGADAGDAAEEVPDEEEPDDSADGG